MTDNEPTLFDRAVRAVQNHPVLVAVLLVSAVVITTGVAPFSSAVVTLAGHWRTFTPAIPPADPACRYILFRRPDKVTRSTLISLEFQAPASVSGERHRKALQGVSADTALALVAKDFGRGEHQLNFTHYEDKLPPGMAVPMRQMQSGRNVFQVNFDATAYYLFETDSRHSASAEPMIKTLGETEGARVATSFGLSIPQCSTFPSGVTLVTRETQQ